MKNKEILYLITKWVELNQKTISHYFLFKHYSEDHQKDFCVPNDLSMARGRGWDRCSEVPGYSRRRPYKSAVTHQNRIFSGNVVLFRRTHKSSGREREGG